MIYPSALPVLRDRSLAELLYAATPEPAAWAGWDMDEDAAEHWGGELAQAAGGALTAAQAVQLAAGYLASHPDPQDAQGAAAWLAAHGPDLAAAVTAAAGGMIADGFLIGAASGTAAASGEPAGTGGWQPGDTTAAQAQAQALGVGDEATAAAGGAAAVAAAVAVSLGLAMGAALAGAAAGATAAAAGKALRAALTGTAHATAIALGHITTAISKGARAVYDHLGITSVAWHTERDAKVCPVCGGNEAAGPQPLGARWPSGDMWPPAHPNCRCALVPAETAWPSAWLATTIRAAAFRREMLEVLHA